MVRHRHERRSVFYNIGQYETDSIYNRKYLDGSDQYAMFSNPNQVLSVIRGSSESRKLLLIKDSYGIPSPSFQLRTTRKSV